MKQGVNGSGGEVVAIAKNLVDAAYSKIDGEVAA